MPASRRDDANARPTRRTNPGLRCWPLLALLALLTTACATARPDADQVQGDVRRILTALYSGDVGTVLEYTHPAIVAKLGGPELAGQTIGQAVENLRRQGLELESLEFPAPPEFVPGGDTWFALVPTRSVIRGRGQRIESLNFQFGVLESDADWWTYIEGSRIEATDALLLFPEFPRSHRLPPFHRKKLPESR